VFVRKKVTSSGAVKHYLVACSREGGKVRQKVLCYLGDFATVAEAREGLPRLIREHQDAAAIALAQADAARGSLPESYRENPPRPDGRRNGRSVQRTLRLYFHCIPKAARA
jgi:hypothetical protein